MRRIQIAVFGLAMALMSLFYVAGSAWTAQEKEKKDSCADCCCCAKQDSKADHAGMACGMKHKKN